MGAEWSRAGPAGERPGEGLLRLPGGYLDPGGTLHREVELAALTGREEALVADAPAGTPAAALATALLARSTRRIGAITQPGEEVVRDLPVPDRDYLLLHLRRMTLGSRLDAVVRCPGADCGKHIDVSIPLDEFADDERPSPRDWFAVRLASGGEAAFRLPTGRDQEALAELAAMDESRALDELFARCVRGTDSEPVAALPEPVRREIEERMREAAPPVEIQMEGACPECGGEFQSQLSPAVFFLAELRKNARGLEREVHFLAWHYHWGETEILALTAEKRRRYVALIEEELERLNGAPAGR